ncbi:Slp family lipoprotein [Candidatus Thiosymbion oneisti]|nr:Slp family lipoprotein [Candidatus Thiosymbion oneisti]
MRHTSFSIVCSLLLLASCASNLCLPPVGTPSITPSVVSATGDHVGKPIQWGGILIETRHFKEHTELELIAYPLDSCGRPRTGAEQTGRFIIIHPGFLDTTDYQIGRTVSATGRITGIRTGRLGNADYGFPLLESYKVHLWPDQQTRSNYSRPWINIGIGGGDGDVFGGVGVVF